MTNHAEKTTNYVKAIHYGWLFIILKNEKI